jgi:hypothetical protein
MNQSTKDKTIWGIHAGKTGDAATLFLKHSCIALGWDQMGDLSQLTSNRKAFKAAVAKTYPKKKPGAIPNNAGQLFRFLHEIKQGDLVVFPSKSTRKLHLGRIVGDYDDISGTDDETDDTPITDDLTGDNIDFPDPDTPDITINEDPEVYVKKRKVSVNGVEVTIIKERVQYMGGDGKIITESLRDYTRKNVLTSYTSLSSWKEADKKRAIVEELENHGVIFAALKDEVGSAFDPFDLICHVAFEQKPLTRLERAENVKKRDYFTKYGDLARQVLDSLLEKYADDGLRDLEDPAIITLDPIKRLGTAPEIVRAFGGKPAYDTAIRQLTNELYHSA